MKIVLSSRPTPSSSAAGSRSSATRRRTGRQPPGVRAAPDPGLDAGLHSFGAAGGDRRHYFDELIPVSGADGMEWAKKLAQKEGIFTGVSGGSTFKVAMDIAAKSPQGHGHPVHAARHRRALSLLAAVPGDPRVHERGGDRVVELHAGRTGCRPRRRRSTLGNAKFAKLVPNAVDHGLREHHAFAEAAAP